MMIDPQKIAPVYKVIDLVRKAVIVILFAFIVITMATQIILRVLPVQQLAWADEILRYINIWVVFLGAGIAVKHSAHLHLNFFVERFIPQSRHNLIEKARSIIIILCLGVIVVFGISKTISSRTVYVQSVEISMAWFYLAIPVGTALMIVDYLLILLYGDHPFIEKNTAEGDSC